MPNLLLWIICSKVSRKCRRRLSTVAQVRQKAISPRLCDKTMCSRGNYRHYHPCRHSSKLDKVSNWRQHSTLPCVRSKKCLFGVTSLCFKRPTNTSEEEEVWLLCQQPLNKHGQCLIQQKSESKWRFCSSHTFLVFLC